MSCNDLFLIDNQDIQSLIRQQIARDESLIKVYSVFAYKNDIINAVKFISSIRFDWISLIDNDYCDIVIDYIEKNSPVLPYTEILTRSIIRHRLMLVKYLLSKISWTDNELSHVLYISLDNYIGDKSPDIRNIIISIIDHPKIILNEKMICSMAIKYKITDPIRQKLIKTYNLANPKNKIKYKIGFGNNCLLSGYFVIED